MADRFDSDWLREQLSREGRSQSALARHMGLHQSAVNRIVNGTRQVKAQELQSIREYLALGSGPPSISAVPLDKYERHFAADGIETNHRHRRQLFARFDEQDQDALTTSGVGFFKKLEVMIAEGLYMHISGILSLNEEEENLFFGSRGYLRDIYAQAILLRGLNSDGPDVSGEIVRLIRLIRVAASSVVGEPFDAPEVREIYFQIPGADADPKARSAQMRALVLRNWNILRFALITDSFSAAIDLVRRLRDASKVLPSSE